MRRNVMTVACGLALLLGAGSAVGMTLFLDPTVGLPFQEAQELAFLNATGALTMIHFDDVPPNTILTGNEWAGLGIVFSQPGGYSLQALGANQNFTPRSDPNSLFPLGATGIDERLQMDLIVPQIAVGFWLIDSEFTQPGYDETIEFYNANNELILSVPQPRSEIFGGGTEGNFFIGLVSPENLIARVILNEAPAEPTIENVGWDNVYFGVPEPSTLALLAVGGLVLRRR